MITQIILPAVSYKKRNLRHFCKRIEICFNCNTATKFYDLAGNFENNTLLKYRDFKAGYNEQKINLFREC
jgi:hypothetical protein